MMKYLPNHHHDFSAPGNAFAVGFMQALVGICTELACILYLGSINSEIDVIIRFIALGSIAKVDDFYYNALPSENRVLGKVADLTVSVHRRHFRDPEYKGAEITCSYYLTRFIYKTMRIFYSSFIFYFFPYFTLVAPYLFRTVQNTA